MRGILRRLAYARKVRQFVIPCAALNALAVHGRGGAVVRADRLDVLVPERLQIADRLLDAVRNEWRVLDRLRAPRDEELLRRHGLDANAATADDALYRDVVHQLRFGRHHPGRIGLRSRVRVRRLLDDLDVRVLHQHRNLRDIDALVLLAHVFLRVVPPDFNDADLLDQRVLDRSREDLVSLVLRIEHVIDVIRRLLGRLLVLRLTRSELDRVVACGENLHQRRQHPFDGIADGRIDDLAAAFDGRRREFAFRQAKVEIFVAAPLLGKPTAHVRDARADFRVRHHSERVVCDCHVKRS